MKKRTDTKRGLPSNYTTFLVLYAFQQFSVFLLNFQIFAQNEVIKERNACSIQFDTHTYTRIHWSAKHGVHAIPFNVITYIYSASVWAAWTYCIIKWLCCLLRHSCFIRWLRLPHFFFFFVSSINAVLLYKALSSCERVVWPLSSLAYASCLCCIVCLIVECANFWKIVTQTPDKAAQSRKLRWFRSRHLHSQGYVPCF